MSRIIPTTIEFQDTIALLEDIINDSETSPKDYVFALALKYLLLQ